MVDSKDLRMLHYFLLALALRRGSGMMDGADSVADMCNVNVQVIRRTSLALQEDRS